MNSQKTGRSRNLSMSANSPQPRPVNGIRHGSRQSAVSTKTRPRLAATPQRQRPRMVRRQATTQNCPRPQPRSLPTLAVNANRQRIVRAVASSWPFRHRPIFRFTSAAFKLMSSFDPAAVRKAVEEFTPRRPQKFQDLLPAKEVITELRQKRASYRSISDLLTQHCLPTSKTAIAMFCHQVLGESLRPRKRPGRKRPPVPTTTNGEATTPESAPASNSSAPVESVANPEGGEAAQSRARGPRIAQVRMLKPQTT
jgi:hypothetical protein